MRGGFAVLPQRGERPRRASGPQAGPPWRCPDGHLAYPAGEMSPGTGQYVANHFEPGVLMRRFCSSSPALPGGPFTSGTAVWPRSSIRLRFLGFTWRTLGSAVVGRPGAAGQPRGIPNPSPMAPAGMPAAPLDGVFTPGHQATTGRSTPATTRPSTPPGPITVGFGQSWPCRLATGSSGGGRPGSRWRPFSFFAIPRSSRWDKRCKPPRRRSKVVIRSVGTLPALDQAGSQSNADGFAPVTAAQDMGGSPSVFMGPAPVTPTPSSVRPVLVPPRPGDHRRGRA